MFQRRPDARQAARRIDDACQAERLPCQLSQPGDHSSLEWPGGARTLLSCACSRSVLQETSPATPCPVSPLVLGIGRLRPQHPFLEQPILD